MSGWEYWGVENMPQVTMSVIDDGLQTPAGFVVFKEKAMKPTDAQIEEMRRAAKLASSMPEIEHEINGMQNTTLTQAFAAIRDGTLTPEKAMSYWMELYSYHRLTKRFETKAALAASVTK